MARILSPRYPNISLEEAIRSVGKIFEVDRRSPVERSVAAQHMGFSGITGSSDRVLSALMHFGLLEKVGKGEVRVSQTAVDILHPDSTEDQLRALQEAAATPSLFRSLHDRYGEVIPSAETLRSHLTRQGFIASAVGAAANAYLETRRYLQQMGASESGSSSQDDDLASDLEAPSREEKPMERMQAEGQRHAPPPPVLDAALNDIRTEIAGGEVKISARLDREGLRKLKRKIDAMLALIGDDEDEPDPVD